jgi:hypothetical protein
MMLGTTVPETPVEEDRDLGSGENNVCCAANLRDWPEPHPIAQTQGVDGGSQCEFRLGITTLVPAHNVANGERGCPGLGLGLRRHFASEWRRTGALGRPRQP